MAATTMRLIAKQTLGSDTASVTFSDIPSTYTDLYLVYSARSAISDTYDDLKIRFNGSTTGYSCRILYGYNTTPASASFAEILGMMVSGNTATSNTFGSGEIYIPNYASTTVNKSVSLTSCSENNSSTMVFLYAAAGLWSNTAAITSLTIDDYSGGSNIKSGSSFFLYGITKA
jgi:hypothetical protein